ncbi:Glucose-methanol-choline oxidoreductase [Colletotrichum higginsianum IMI 349063]|uniref:Glucose-methanol-choline oxidoreductase n=2 Tax=Colletotrichum higginsianum TaxID=80884 RepID=A0A1B7XTR7_COLHI|nr:Glucose-methanol-choline oxidoreductase [Colletotrichum higginsianum IMI 349063]OBR03150.1 Glucose-methanol-choline oxidoreductase [Colletotrichum higginsianum IMI 349063]TIC90871.1 Dehydrogenase patE [Colletotrichum higginsianum]
MHSLPSPSQLLTLGSSLLLSSTSLVSAAANPRSACSQADGVLGFDYVIVGGGTAGLVLANRLTEDAGVTVAVVEAGTLPEDVSGNWTQVPGYAGKFFSGAPEMSWGFQTTPQAGLNNSTAHYLRTKALGGCSNVNYMAYSHTTKGAHAAWAAAVNDESYSYENMLPYYRKTMKFSPPKESSRLANATVRYNEASVATSGAVDVTYPAYSQPWSTWVSKGLAAIGVNETDTFIDGTLIGHTWQMDTVRASDSHRSSSETAYLRPVLDRPNLAVFHYTTVERVLFSNKTATGVEFSSATTDSSCTGTISAAKEVILSAGAFQSPQLLQVSGVGPKDLLSKYGIPVVADVPAVGRGMRDHMTIFASYQVNVVTSSALSGADYLASAIDDFNTKGEGPLASSGGDLVGGEKIPDELRKNFADETVEYLSPYPADWPEVLYNVYPGGVTEAVANENFATLQATLMMPHSQGTVMIQSANISDAPAINPNWLTENSDMDVLVAGFKRVRQALESSAMAPVLVGGEVFPGPTVATDDDIRAYIRRSSSPIYHAFASNRMGNGTDPQAVVDSRGRVVGVSRLRVIDSSSFPFLPPTPAPQVQVYVLAEKLADDIKKTTY